MKEKNTERIYFESFPVVSATVDCRGVGMSRLTLVKRAFELSKQPDNRGKETWCVFDYDYSSSITDIAEDFNHAIRYAEEKDLKVAYSNDSFELWFLCHYQLIESKLTRFEYYEKLSGLWKINYEEEGKKYDFCKSLFIRLQNDPRADVYSAFKNAEKLLKNVINEQPSNQNPCTKVHELVKELLKYLRQ